MRVQCSFTPARPARPAPPPTVLSAAFAPRSMPAEPAPQAPRERSDEPGTWFEAPCVGGRMHLCVGPDAPTAPHAAAAAILLHEVEPVLGPIDDWMGAECAWRWTEAPPSIAPGSCASARWRGDAPQRSCVLSWPWALLRSLPAPPPALAACLDWGLVASVLVLARLQVDPAELDTLEPGGAVLLPPSMQPAWQGWMRAADEPSASQVGVPVDLSTPWRPRLAARDAAACLPPPDPMRVACELRLDLPLGVSAHRLAGWQAAGDAGEIVRLAESGLRAALWRAATPRHAELRLAAGTLMPWGDGWALAVETLPSAPHTPDDGGVLQKV